MNIEIKSYYSSVKLFLMCNEYKLTSVHSVVPTFNSDLPSMLWWFMLIYLKIKVNKNKASVAWTSTFQASSEGSSASAFVVHNFRKFFYFIPSSLDERGGRMTDPGPVPTSKKLLSTMSNTTIFIGIYYYISLWFPF